MVQKQDLLQLYKEFGNHVDTNLNVVKLIRMCDVNGNSVLDASEIREMLSVKNTSARPFTRRRLITKHNSAFTTVFPRSKLRT